MAKLISKKFAIKGMHCSSCVMLIEGDLEDLPGVNFAKTDFATGECEVEFDSEAITESVIIAKILQTGYVAKTIS